MKYGNRSVQKNRKGRKKRKKTTTKKKGKKEEKITILLKAVWTKIRVTASTRSDEGKKVDVKREEIAAVIQEESTRLNPRESIDERCYAPDSPLD